MLSLRSSTIERCDFLMLCCINVGLHFGLAPTYKKENKNKTKKKAAKKPLSKIKPWRWPTFTWGDLTLSSAHVRFTSEFEKGSGGSKPLWSPGKLLYLLVDLIHKIKQTKWSGKYWGNTKHFICCANFLVDWFQLNNSVGSRPNLP